MICKACKKDAGFYVFQSIEHRYNVTPDGEIDYNTLEVTDGGDMLIACRNCGAWDDETGYYFDGEYVTPIEDDDANDNR